MAEADNNHPLVDRAHNQKAPHVTLFERDLGVTLHFSMFTSELEGVLQSDVQLCGYHGPDVRKPDV